ncbi:MAG: VWA domain-containing protein, partial [Candidatus Nealsonbacteria bacterium]|nr:VWA domain-containing protein [Candidatus Nealsonbacteria bacterium]
MDMEIVPLDDPSQLPGVLPTDLILEDEEFYSKLVNGELLRPEYRETSTEFKRLYILWDISASMWQSMSMPDGEAGNRDIWARAVIAGLLVDAVKGRAEYFLRPFTGSPQELRSVFTSAEAEKLLSWILDGSEKGSSTNIGIAVETAVDDIRKRQNAETRMNHILLITDGEDNSLTKEQLEKALGKDIKLHVVLIGTTYGLD